MPCCLLPSPSPSSSLVLDRRICAFLRRRFPFVVSSLVVVPSGPTLLSLFPRARTTIYGQLTFRLLESLSEKIGLAPASQLLGPAILQSRELVASSWHGLGRPRFRVNFIIRGPVRGFASRSRIGTSRCGAAGNIARLICVQKIRPIYHFRSTSGKQS